MHQILTSKFNAIVVVHLAIAVAPLGMAFVPPDIRTLPVLWGLASIPLSQIMLLSVWLGMTRGSAICRIAIAILAVLYITIWPSLGEILMRDEETPNPMPSVYWQYTGVMLVFLAVLSAVMAGAKRVVGFICFTSKADALSTETRSQYSLFTLLAMTTATAMILGLVRSSQTSSADGIIIAQYLLAIVVLVVNVVVTVWATLGTGHVVRRLVLVFLVSTMLGLALAIGAGNSLDTGPWWLLTASSLILVVPTTIVAVTLLVIRTLGYRLQPRQKLGFSAGSHDALV